MEIEVSGFLGLGVNQEAPAPDLDSQLCGPADGISEETGTQSPALMLSGNPKPGKQRDRLGVPPSTPAHPGWSILNRDAGHRPGVVGDHKVTVNRRDDQHLRCARRVGLTRMVAQPLGLFGGSTLELVQNIIGLKHSGRPILLRHSSVNGDGRAINSRRPVRLRGRRRLISSQAARAPGSSTNSVRSASTRREATVRFEITKSVRSVPDAATARSISERSSGVVRTSRRSLRVRFVSVATVLLPYVRPVYGQS